jgi:3-oxocholest-4-en-26-oyl-CoA dehydrogenase beta subunit
VDFSYTEEQEALRQLARRLFSERFTDDYRRVFVREGRPYDATLWAALAQAGILGTAVATEEGGSGLGLTDLALVLEEQGRTLAAVPLLATLLMGAMPLGKFGSAAQRALLRRVVSGELLLTAALEETGGTDPLRPATTARGMASGWQLSGVKTCVPYALEADYVLVSAALSDSGATQLFILERGAAGTRLEPQRSTSGEPQAELTLNDVRVSERDRLGADAVAAAAALPWLVGRAQVALAALQLGIVEEALRRAAAHVSERHQFGRPLGSFQAVQHRLADCYIDTEALRSAYLAAVWALDQGLPARAEVLAAKWWAAQAGHRVTHAVQHVHGGLGADVEYPVHRFLLHAKQLEVALGGATASLAGIGTELARGTVMPFT